jgi:N-acetylglutamate synthase-like GNAT family acetyltransferase
MELQLRQATPDDAAALTELAHAAKRHWGYPERWIELWKDDLTITPEFVANSEVFVALLGAEIVGCCALVLGSNSTAELEHMWIKPAQIGTGVGRILFEHAKGLATKLNVRRLEISSDPNAEGFYRHMGATRIGEVRSEIEGQPRLLPRMAVDLEPVHK